jgi:hypothetical protein
MFGGRKGSAMHKSSKNMSLRTLAGVVAAGLQNLGESFFGSLSRALNAPMRQLAPIHAFAEPSVRFKSLINPRSQHVEPGPAKAFRARTCNGHYFPVRARADVSTAEACHAFCPASETRLYSGSTIDYARAREGSRYAALDTAYTYRRSVVAGCTCNGRYQFRLAHIEVAADPKLRPGDVVATRNGRQCSPVARTRPRISRRLNPTRIFPKAIANS